MATSVLMDFELPNRVVGDDEAKRLLMKLMDTAFAEVDGHIGHNRWCSTVEPGVYKERGEPGGHLMVSFDVNDDSIPLLARKIFLRVWEEMSHAWLEVEAKATVQAKPAPKGLIIGIVIGVLVIGGGVVAKIKSDHAAAKTQARVAAQVAAQKDELLRKEQKLAIQAQIKKLTKQLSEAKMTFAESAERLSEITKLTKQLSEAKSDADLEALRQQIAEASSRRATATAATR